MLFRVIPRCSLKIDALKNFVNFTRKRLCWSLIAPYYNEPIFLEDLVRTASFEINQGVPQFANKMTITTPQTINSDS